MKKIILIALLGLWGTTIIQASPNEKVPSNVAVKPNSPSLVVKAATPQFTLRLAANPTTGYLWSVKQYDTHLLTVVKNEFIPPKGKLIGAGGIEIWTFKAKPAAFAAPTMTFITMEYARPWEKQGGKQVTITVKTQPYKN